jgi:hypothetical protein
VAQKKINREIPSDTQKGKHRESKASQLSRKNAFHPKTSEQEALPVTQIQQCKARLVGTTIGRNRYKSVTFLGESTG